jgi:hypothetical protein
MREIDSANFRFFPEKAMKNRPFAGQIRGSQKGEVESGPVGCGRAGLEPTAGLRRTYLFQLILSKSVSHFIRSTGAMLSMSKEWPINRECPLFFRNLPG